VRPCVFVAVAPQPSGCGLWPAVSVHQKLSYEVCEIWFYTAADTTTKDEQMTRRSIEERLAQLEAQRKTLQARLGKQERARDTRRKVLLGALVLNRLEKSDDGEFSKRLGDWLRRELPGFLTRDDDKLLFSDILEIEKQDV
jgi:hypothetical protein